MATLRARVIPKYPRLVQGTGGITVSETNGTATIGFDYTASALGSDLTSAVSTATNSASSAATSATTATNEANIATTQATNASASAASATASATSYVAGWAPTAGNVVGGTINIAVGSPAVLKYRYLNDIFRQIPNLYDFGFVPNLYSQNNETRFSDLITTAESNTWARRVGVPPGNWVVEAWPGFITSSLSFTGIGNEICNFYPDFVPAQSNWGLFTYSAKADGSITSNGASLDNFGIIRQNTHGNGGASISAITPTNVAIGRITLSRLYMSTATGALNYQIYCDGSANNGAAPSLRGVNIDNCAIFGAQNYAMAFTRTNSICINNSWIATAGGITDTCYIAGDVTADSDNHSINLAAGSLNMDRCNTFDIRIAAATNVTVGSLCTFGRVGVGKLSGAYSNSASSVSFIEGLTGTIKGDASNGLQYLPNRRIRKWMTISATTSVATYTWATQLGASDVPFAVAPTVVSCLPRNSVAAYANYVTNTATSVEVISSASCEAHVVAEGSY